MANNKLTIKKDSFDPFSAIEKKDESGFSLIEVIIALVILLVTVLGVFAAFTFATTYNAGNSRRSQALSVLQEEVELLRSAKFTRNGTDNYAPTTPDNGRRDLTGGEKAIKTVTLKKEGGLNGNSYTVKTIVDDDPFNPGIDIDSCSPSCTKTLKEITVIVTPQAINGNWVVAFPTKFVFRRVRAN